MKVIVSNYLRNDDVPNPQEVTITSVELETVGQGEKAEEKYVVYFKEVQQGLVLNQTNKKFLVGAFTDESDKWIGKKLVLFYDPNVYFQGKRVGGLKLRAS